jgi:hypothetical protein
MTWQQPASAQQHWSTVQASCAPLGRTKVSSPATSLCILQFYRKISHSIQCHGCAKLVLPTCEVFVQPGQSIPIALLNTEPLGSVMYWGLGLRFLYDFQAFLPQDRDPSASIFSKATGMLSPGCTKASQVGNTSFEQPWHWIECDILRSQNNRVKGISQHWTAQTSSMQDKPHSME